MLSKHRGLRAIAAALGATAALSGCAAVVPMTAGPQASSVRCADVIVRLPEAIGELERRDTGAQGTGAWSTPGDSSAVLLRCGVEPLGPTTFPCFTVKDVDWIRDDSDAPIYVFTTYGREPAIEVVIDSEKSSGTAALVDLANPVGTIPAEQHCTVAEDVLN